MGGGASAEKKEQSGEQPKQQAKDTYEEKYKAAQNDLKSRDQEIEKLRKQLNEKNAAPVVIAPASSTDNQSGDCVFQVIVTAEQATAISKLGVAYKNLQGSGSPLVAIRENVLLVSCAPAKVAEVIKIATAPYEIVKLPKPVPDAPPPSFGEKPMQSNEKDEAEQSKEEEKPKVAVPDKNLSAKTDINLGSWDGKVKLRFTWLNEPSTYSEYNDPSGSNWWATTNVRKAPDAAPKEVTLEWRRGMNGAWTSVPCKVDPHGAWCELVLPIETIEPVAFRGFQSRWIVDGEKYLTPLQLAPTLQSKLMAYPMVRSAVKALPADKQTLDNIPNEDLRKAVLAIENIIPMNTWDYAYGLTLMPGAMINDEHVLTLPEKVEWIAKQKTNDPAIVSEIRKTILKSPIMAANAAAGLVGIKLKVIVDNLDFFLPKFADPNFGDLEALEATQLEWEKLRREMQTDVNGLYPTFQHGIRVTFPPARVLRNALQAKRPTAEVVTMPLSLTFDLDEENDFLVKHAVQFVHWTTDYAQKTVVECQGEEAEETFGLINKETKKTWRKYKANVSLAQGHYKYHWIYDGKNYFNNGAPFGDFQPPAAHLQFTVDASVVFGIGVPF